jgi:hypothetical protein
VAYMDWLVNIIMSIIWFDFAQKPAEWVSDSCMKYYFLQNIIVILLSCMYRFLAISDIEPLLNPVGSLLIETNKSDVRI